MIDRFLRLLCCTLPLLWLWACPATAAPELSPAAATADVSNTTTTAAPAEAAPASHPALALIGGNFASRKQAALALAESNEPRAALILEALVAGQLYGDADSGQLVIKGKGTSQNALTGEALANLPGGLRKVAVNNALRGQIRALLAGLSLRHDDAAVRRSAALQLMTGAGDGRFAAIASAQLAVETDTEVKELLQQVLAISTLGSGDQPARLAAIGWLRAGYRGERLRDALKGAADVERITARTALRQVRPRELVGLGKTLQKSELLALNGRAPEPFLVQIFGHLHPPEGCTALLQAAIAEEPAALVRDGGVIANGFDTELDELRAIQTNCDAFLLELETREKARTGIANLRVQFNKVHGFYIEVTQGQLDKVPDDYRRRQTLKNAERFITPELKTFEDKALSAQERALAREKWLYEGLLDQLQPFVPALTALAQAMASLDVLCALTERSLTLNWCAPEFAKEPCIEIRQGRHPVVEARLAEMSGASFIANDTVLGQRQRLQIITGPNMGGKSTYMRQVALIVLLASIGSHVPASRCRLGPIDAIHTRIGAADDLANAQSTFMLEMTEAAQILHAATPHSLVLMDEIGRGTSTFDGLALASGIATHLHDKTRAFTLFATHYFELTELPAKARHAINMHVSATESGTDIVFLHEIQPGPASRSYGIQVAKLAGMPSPVLHHARHALAALEERAGEDELQVDLFAAPEVPESAGASPLEAALAGINPDALSPREALDALYQLKKMAG